MKTHKDKKLKASVRNMLKLNIHNPTLMNYAPTKVGGFWEHPTY